MKVDRVFSLFAALERDLYTFLRGASEATMGEVARSLRLSPGDVDVLESLRGEAQRLSPAAFEAARQRRRLADPEREPFWRLRRAREHRSDPAQARETAAFGALVEGKRVALVGPSLSIAGSGLGATIEACDLVVRMNFQWPVPETLVADAGERMDVLYHCCNGDYPVDDLFVPAFARTRFVCWEANAESFWLEAHCAENGIPSLDVSPLYAQLADVLCTAPFTGTVAIEHLRGFAIAELLLAGISFGAEPYYPGYRGHGASAPEVSRALHATEPQLRYFREVIARDARVRLDPLLQRLLAG